MYGSEVSGTFRKYDGTSAVKERATDKLLYVGTKSLSVAVLFRAMVRHLEMACKPYPKDLVQPNLKELMN